MPISLRKPFLSRTAIAALLIVAVLFAQWMGVMHRISHADRSNGPIISIAGFDVRSAGPATDRVADGNTDNHSCTAFDAATLADALPVPFVCASLQPGAALIAARAAFDSWDAPLAHFYSPRAPPLG